MLVRNVSGRDLEIGGTDVHPDLGKECAAGDTVDVADELAELLLEQPTNWERATPAKKAHKADETEEKTADA